MMLDFEASLECANGSLFTVLGGNHQDQQNNTSEETALSNVMAPEQCTLSLVLSSVTVCSFGSSQGHGCFSFWSVEGLQGGTGPKSVPHGSVQGLTFHLKLNFFFFL